MNYALQHDLSLQQLSALHVSVLVPQFLLLQQAATEVAFLSYLQQPCNLLYTLSGAVKSCVS
jgi:hypothetical protein